VVFIPFATRYKDPAKFGSKNIDLFKYHTRESPEISNQNTKINELNYFIGQDKTIIDLYREEAWAESIRLLYVAITRAEYRCYLCATPFTNFYLSPLGQTLKLSAGDDLLSGLTRLLDQETEAQNIHLQQVDEIDFPVTRHVDSKINMQEMPAQFTGRIERNWWLSSFSALTRNLRHGGISTPDRDQDECLDDQQIESESKNDIRFTLTKGAATGNLLHDILEHTDFSQAHWERSLERPLSRFNETLDAEQQSELVNWLEVCLDSRLDICNEEGPKLNELSWSKTLRETEFYFPMEQVKPHRLGQLLAKHREQRLNLDSKHKNNRQTNPIQLPGNKALQGMMHGFIDLIFQWQDKYYVVDYKSTHLGNRLEHYEQNALEKNIRDNYYDLQYLLYSLALHRYLKSRKTDYDPQQHFGGIHYLYLRGMTPGSKKGIFTTHISPELLSELDELFTGNKFAGNKEKESQSV
jgi:exodeoxyribonuclease V beta subunit